MALLSFNVGVEIGQLEPSWPSSFYWSGHSASSKCAGRAGPKPFPATQSAPRRASGRFSAWRSCWSAPDDTTDRTAGLDAEWCCIFVHLIWTQLPSRTCRKARRKDFSRASNTPSRASITCWQWLPSACGAPTRLPSHMGAASRVPHGNGLRRNVGLMGVPLPGVEYGIAASAIVLGVAVLFETRPPLRDSCGNGRTFRHLPRTCARHRTSSGQSGLLYSMGFVIATGCLHGVGISIGTVHRWDWGQRILRLAGAVVAMGGVLFHVEGVRMKPTVNPGSRSTRTLSSLRDVSPRSPSASELHRHGSDLRRPDALPDEP